MSAVSLVLTLTECRCVLRRASTQMISVSSCTHDHLIIVWCLVLGTGYRCLGGSSTGPGGGVAASFPSFTPKVFPSHQMIRWLKLWRPSAWKNVQIWSQILNILQGTHDPYWEGLWHRYYPSPPLDNIRVMVIVWRLRGNIIGTALCWVVWHNVHSQQHTYMSSSYRSSRLGLSYWEPYAMHRGGCLELYYCNMVEWPWWDSSLIWKTVFLQCFDTVGLVIWPVKIVPEMTYNVLSGTLSLYTTTVALLLSIETLFHPPLWKLWRVLLEI